METPWQRAAALAETQLGLLLLGQARSAGLSDDQVEYAAARGGWVRLERSLYALPGSTPSWRRDVLAALLLAGGDSVASHLTTAALWTWCAPPLLPHVTVPVQRSCRSKRARVHRSDVPVVDRATRQGLRCTSASRTLVDCAGLVAGPRLEQFVDDAFCSGVATPESTRAALDRVGRRGRRGVPMLESVIGVWSEDIAPDTPAEARLLRRLAAIGVVDVVTQHDVFDEAGRFVARLDIAAPGRRVGWEYDSDRWHNPRRWAHDEPRYARLAALGWAVDAVCKQDLLPSSTSLADRIGALSAA